MKLVICLTLLLLSASAAPTVQHLKTIIKAKKREIAAAVLGLFNAENWENEISGIFEENAQHTVKEFLNLVQNKTSDYDNWAEYFRAETDEIIYGFLALFGAEGDDMESTSANFINVTIVKLLAIFAANLEEKEVKAISGSASGLVRTVVQIINDTQNFAMPISDYVRNEIADLAAVGLKRLLGDDSNIYKFISTFL